VISDGRDPVAVLKSTWGYDVFRPLQREVIDEILAGRDAFALMPTGGGKSVCFQLPALLLQGITVVVSPLIALMKDQVDGLRAIGVPAAYINSSLPPGEASRRAHAAEQGEFKLLYVAPERLGSRSFQQLLQTLSPSLFAIDEAHCISEWGHDFRPDYRQLRILRERFPSVPIAAFTATATERVREDIVKQLGLTGARQFVGSFNRPNLFYRVLPKNDSYRQLLTYLRRRSPKEGRHPAGIVYRFSRAGTEELATRLRADGIEADAYHAGLDDDTRRKRQEQFAHDEVQVIVATIAFGLGINKPDVRFVAHYDLPKNLESYYQESGRAGRDGEPSDCLLFFSRADVMMWERFLAQKETASERRHAVLQLRAMTAWAESLSCRRERLLEYFGERLAGAREEACCDRCSPAEPTVDATREAQMFLSCVKRTGGSFGRAHIAAVLRGSRDKRVVARGHDRISTYGIGRHWDDLRWRALAEELIRLGCLDRSEHGGLSLTRHGLEVATGGEAVRMALPEARPASPSRDEIDQPHADLFERLRLIRRRIAEERGVPPYVVLFDRPLRLMAAQLPRTRADLGRIPGIGEHKVLAFGDQFLLAIAAYVKETGATPVVLVAAGAPARVPSERPARASGSADQTAALFRQGRTVREIADERGLSPSTVMDHLAAAVEAGDKVDVDRLVPPRKRDVIAAVFAEVGSDYLSSAKDRLGDGYAYFELKLTRALLRCQEQAAGNGPKPGTERPLTTRGSSAPDSPT
jgi:ATP-dependent DNA helicase RecQ